MAGLFSEQVKGYRADPKGRYGGKDRLETLPTKLDKNEMYNILSAFKDAEQLGMPKISDEQIANMFLNEGRSDAGFNSFNKNNPKATQLYEGLKQKGHDELGSQFAAAVLDKTQTAKRLGKDFNEIWNGTGISQEGRTGAQNAQRMSNTQYAATAPKNSELMSFIQAARNNSLSKEDALTVSTANSLNQGTLLGGMQKSEIKAYIVNSLAESDPQAAKYIKNLSEGAVYQLVQNDLLNKNNIASREPNLFSFSQMFLDKPRTQAQANQDRIDRYTESQLLFGKPTVASAVNRLTTLPVGQKAEQPKTVYQEPSSFNWKDPFGFSIK